MEKSQDGVSYGIGEQSKRPHGIFEASGIEAHVLATWFFNTKQLCSDSIYCTRIDLQVTKRHKARPDYVKLHKRLQGPKQLILGDEGCTLYSGNRQSDSFYRLYDKTPQDIRLEVELKGKQAKIAWTQFMMTGECAPIYQTYLQRTKIPSIITKLYRDSTEVLDLAGLAQHEQPDMAKKLDWLKTLDQLVYKLANDHDTQVETAKLISRWYEYTTKD